MIEAHMEFVVHLFESLHDNREVGKGKKAQEGVTATQENGIIDDSS